MRFSWILVACYLVVAGQANASTYVFSLLETLGGSSSHAHDINSNGQVVGRSYVSGDSVYHATLWSANSVIDLGTLDGTNYSEAVATNDAGHVVGNSYNSVDFTFHATMWNGALATDLGVRYASAINNADQVVGGYQTDGYPRFVGAGYTDGDIPHAVLLNSATVTKLGTLGGTDGYAYAINIAGQVVGASSIASNYNEVHATLWNSASTTALDTLGGIGSYAYAINDTGQVAGYSLTPTNDMHATLWNGTAVTDLGSPGTDSIAMDINNAGQVVGYASATDRTNGLNPHATLWNGATVTDLNSVLDASMVSAGWVLQEANGINDSGWIVGSATNTNTGVTRAFMLSVSPVPEPESYAMLLAGLGVVSFASRRRNDKR